MASQLGQPWVGGTGRGCDENWALPWWLRGQESTFPVPVFPPLILYCDSVASTRDVGFAEQILLVDSVLARPSGFGDGWGSRALIVFERIVAWGPE